MTNGHLLYDADCGICTRAAAWLVRCGVGCSVEPITPGRLEELGVDADRAQREIPFALPRVAEVGGTVADVQDAETEVQGGATDVQDAATEIRYGARAIAAALRTGPAWMQVAGTLLDARPVRPVAARVYRLIAENRGRLPGGTVACAMPAQDRHEAPDAERPTDDVLDGALRGDR